MTPDISVDSIIRVSVAHFRSASKAKGNMLISSFPGWMLGTIERKKYKDFWWTSYTGLHSG